MIDFVERRFTYLFVSLAMLVVAIASLALFGIRPGIEFSSGSMMTFTFDRPVSEAELRSTLSGLGHGEAGIQETRLDGFTVAGTVLDGEKAAAFDKALKDKFGPPAVFTSFDEQAGALKAVFSTEVTPADVEAAASTAGISDVKLTATTAAAFIVRMKTVSQSAGTDSSGNQTPSELQQLQAGLKDGLGDFAIFDLYSVSPAVAQDVVQKAIIAVLIASLAILLYITFAFRKMPSPFRWGTCSIIALVHDVLFVLGVFALLGRFMNVEVDAMFITGALTVLGYSVHDTIVVFDRIRENVTRGISRDFSLTVNSSLMETLGRSLNTGITTLLVLIALFLIGGVTIRYFILVMLLGITVGTYSSIFVASQLLVVWEKREWRRFVSWIPFLKPA